MVNSFNKSSRGTQIEFQSAHYLKFVLVEEKKKLKKNTVIMTLKNRTNFPNLNSV